MGLHRGSREEKEALEKYAALKLVCIVKNKKILVKRMQDYHTVTGTRDAKGIVKNDAVLTYRQYLNDASFIALLEGEKEFLLKLKEHLEDPTWGVWLGRKACIPSAPVFAGVYSSEQEAVEVLLDGKPLEAFTHQREVDDFGSGIDSFMDQPVSFDVYARQYAPRRVMLHEAKILTED
jgi:CRISPR system Cascade subunit CasD